MVSTVLANVLESHLGQYLELSDTKISVGSEIKLNNVSEHWSVITTLCTYSICMFSLFTTCISICFCECKLLESAIWPLKLFALGQMKAPAADVQWLCLQ